MDYYKLLEDYLTSIGKIPVNVQEFDDLGHTIKIKYLMNTYENYIEVSPFDLLTFIYNKQ